MQVQYQRFQVNNKIISIEAELNKSNGIHFVLLQDVQDVVPEASRFEIDGKPVRFLSDDFGKRVEPLRVAWHRDVVMDIVTSTSESSLPSTAPPTPTFTPPESKETTPLIPNLNPGYYKPHPRSVHLAARAVSPPEDDWREYLQQQAIRMAILVFVSTLTIVLNKAVYGQLRHADFPGVIYWHVVYIAFFILSIVWFLMLVVLMVEVVWYLIRTPLATKRSMYQRLFDF
ncbi:hypothetical protein BGZ74_001190 [Mortierella antarctica]|nr:hypothetical protein BGZ74_001190 [Mortierella antarctica]KAG0354352.1 hypothetical protein BG005_006556 [Podila minutissima]